MCESCNGADGLSRRALLAGAVGAAGILVARPALALPTMPLQLPTVTVAPGLDIVTRDGWAENRPPRGEIQVETDVRFLLVHHTAEPGNKYGPGDAPALLRSMYDYHTGSAKGWPDIAYNFLIDQFGVVFEGRSGSLTQASIPDATGGSQGFSQLACFIGNLDVQAPTDAARDSMDRVLAYLAERHGVDITPGATTDFVSRGSNRYASGAPVHTKTVAGHRDMSTTTCPGDFAYAMVEDNSFAARASAIRQASATTTTAPTTTTTSTTITEPTTLATTPAGGDEAATPTGGDSHPPVDEESNSGRLSVPLIVAGGALVLGAAAAVTLFLRRSRERSGPGAPAEASSSSVSHARVIMPTTPSQVEFSARLGEDLGADFSMKEISGVGGVAIIAAPHPLVLEDPDLQRFIDTLWDDAESVAEEWQRILLAVEARNGIDSPLIDGVVATRVTVLVRRSGQCWFVVDDDRGTRSARPRLDAKPLVARLDPAALNAVVLAAGDTPASTVREALRGAAPSPGVAILRRAGSMATARENGGLSKEELEGR